MAQPSLQYTVIPANLTPKSVKTIPVAVFTELVDAQRFCIQQTVVLDVQHIICVSIKYTEKLDDWDVTTLDIITEDYQ